MVAAALMMTAGLVSRTHVRIESSFVRSISGKSTAVTWASGDGVFVKETDHPDEVFDRVDTNHDGALSREEFKAFLAHLPPPPPPRGDGSGDRPPPPPRDGD